MGLSKIESMMREAKLRIANHKKRMNKDSQNPIVTGTARAIRTILNYMFGFQLKNDVDHEPTAVNQYCKPLEGRSDFEKMKALAERQRQISPPTKPRPRTRALSSNMIMRPMSCGTSPGPG